MNLLGNLDCEAGWAGVALPGAVLTRISLYATLFSACAPADEPGERHAIWLPAPIDPARLIAHPGWQPPAVQALGGGPRPAIDLAWADPAASAANDRSRTLAIADAIGVALPGACVVASLAELEDQVGRLAGRPWICKARWTAAGRDRARGVGPTIAGELRVRIARMFERFGPLVFEPWLDRTADFGICGEITAGGPVRVREPHRLISDARGGFLGIELASPDSVDRGIAAELCSVAEAAARLVAERTGYRGPFAIDAFAYRAGSAHRLHPLCELNARFSFGWIARALARQLGTRRLGFDAPPSGATVLIAPAADRVTAWCA
ncbi:MAG TPA: hypothetical protein VFT22_22805 [Kofleriaceae bacterium]|nr:hypothetical protein [Kofleriaceae bacterium]